MPAAIPVWRNRRQVVSPLTPALSPLRGEGGGSHSLDMPVTFNRIRVHPCWNCIGPNKKVATLVRTWPPMTSCSSYAAAALLTTAVAGSLNSLSPPAFVADT
jgi:hypothetical protein